MRNRLPSGCDVARSSPTASTNRVFADYGTCARRVGRASIRPMRGAGRISRNDSRSESLRRGRGTARQDPELPGALPDAGENRGVRYGGLDAFQRPDGDVLADSCAGKQTTSGHETLWDEMVASRGASDLRSWSIPQATTASPGGDYAIPTARHQSDAVTQTISLPSTT